ncbi:MAG: phosphate-starvation-inducible protein PsiE [Saezia sp.]
MSHKKIKDFHKKVDEQINVVGRLFVELFHYAALFAIGFVIAWAALLEFKEMFLHGKFNIEGILTLFIYLELGAMVGIYFKTQHMPVRYLIYIAITALTRLLILDVSAHDPSLNASFKILLQAGAILLLCIAVFIVRMASVKYPAHKGDAEEQD